MKILSVPNKDFFSCLTEMLKENEEVTFAVKGHSMYPFLRNEKDRVAVRKCCPETLRRGDVILFLYKDNYILHRIVRRLPVSSDGKIRFLMRGDGNVRGEEIADSEKIYAIMTKRITPSGKEWRCSSFSWRLCSSAWSFVSPLRRVLLAIIRRVCR